MRLLFLHERMGALGGAEVNILATAAELRRRGHTLALACTECTGRDEASWREVFPECFLVTGATRGAALQKVLTDFAPDVVFTHKMADLEILGALLDAGRPVVRMVHDHELCCMRGCKYSHFSRKICTRAASLYCVFPCGASVARNSGARVPFRWVSYLAKRRELALNRQIDRLVVATDYMRAELLRNGFAAEQIEVHAPVPVPRATAGAMSPDFGDRNRLVYAGQIIRGKGVDVLLESLARVRAPFECVILGDGNHRAECERLSARLGLTDRVRFEGFVSQARVAEYYREASVAVMSSLWPEPFGATGLEAMRLGLPVVAFDAGGIREWLLDGVNGFLVPWMDRGAFAGRIDDLLADKSFARRLGENGRRLADERFSFQTYLDGLERLLARTGGQTLAATASSAPELTPASEPATAPGSVPAYP